MTGDAVIFSSSSFFFFFIAVWTIDRCAHLRVEITIGVEGPY